MRRVICSIPLRALVLLGTHGAMVKLRFVAVTEYSSNTRMATRPWLLLSKALRRWCKIPPSEDTGTTF